MHGRRTFSCWVGSLALLGGSASCASAQSLVSALLPPAAPAARAAFFGPDPPPLDAPPQLGDSTRFTSPLPPASLGSRADVLVREAEWHYQSGRAYYQGGDVATARREFDRAIDLLLAAPEDAAIRVSTDKKLDELVDAIHRFDLAELGAGDAASEPGFEKPPLEDILPQLTFPVDPALKDKVMEELKATSSQLPLEITDPVLSYINFFSTGRGRRVLIYGVQRSGRYRPLIRRILDEEGVPQELIYLAQAESGFQPRAVSRKKATGMWQFMQARGREYGLQQSASFDDRLDPEKAKRAAARHLHDLYQHFGDWYLAMAAYDCGPVNVDRGVERTGYADFWELRSRGVLPKETANYVPAILAMTIIMKNAKEYGLEGVDADPPLEFDTLDLAAATQLQLVADLAECPVSQLHDLNPALLKNVAPGGSTLRVPKGSGPAVGAGLEMVPADKRASWRVHRVSGGDKLDAIAQRYGVARSSIVAANPAGDGALEAGDLLLIPAASARTAISAKRAGRRRATVPQRASASVPAHRAAASQRVSATAPAHRAAASQRASATAVAASSKRTRTQPPTYTAASIRKKRAAAKQ